MLRGRVLHGLDDVDVAGAPAEVARDRVADFVVLGVPALLEEGVAGQHHPRRAEATLQAVLLHEAFLDGMELAVLLQPFDGGDVAAVGLHGQHRARLHGHAVEEDGAGAAVRGVAADVGAGEPEALAQQVDEQQARLHLCFEGRAVDGDVDVMLRHRYFPPARWAALRKARTVSTRAISFLYSTEPRRSAPGLAAAPARRPASANAASSAFLPARYASAAVALTGVGPTLVSPIPARSTAPPLMTRN